MHGPTVGEAANAAAAASSAAAAAADENESVDSDFETLDAATADEQDEDVAFADAASGLSGEQRDKLKALLERRRKQVARKKGDGKRQKRAGKDSHKDADGSGPKKPSK